MTRTRWLIVFFWLFVIAGLTWQCHDGSTATQQEQAAHPTEDHFFFTAPLTNSAGPTQPAPPTVAPNVRQTKFVVHRNAPGFGSFTCDVTIVNEGQQTATNVQVHVRPYRGVMFGNDVLGHTGYRALPDNDPLSQYGTWLSFPDLKQGESATQSVTFLSHANVEPGFNANPEITCEPAK